MPLNRPSRGRTTGPNLPDDLALVSCHPHCQLSMMHHPLVLRMACLEHLQKLQGSATNVNWHQTQNCKLHLADAPATVFPNVATKMLQPARNPDEGRITTDQAMDPVQKWVPHPEMPMANKLSRYRFPPTLILRAPWAVTLPRNTSIEGGLYDHVGCNDVTIYKIHIMLCANDLHISQVIIVVDGWALVAMTNITLNSQGFVGEKTHAS